jgi:hypothetical protein
MQTDQNAPLQALLSLYRPVALFRPRAYCMQCSVFFRNFSFKLCLLDRLLRGLVSLKKFYNLSLTALI